MAKGKRHRGESLGFLGQGRTVPLRFELLDSAAYYGLSLTAKALFVEMARAYFSASDWDTRPIEYFIFPYDGKLNIGECAFQKAVTEICGAGFFDAPPERQEQRVASPRRYVPSREWQSIQISPEEAMRRDKRIARVLGKRARRSEKRAAMNGKKTLHAKHADSLHAKHADSFSEESASYMRGMPILGPES